MDILIDDIGSFPLPEDLDRQTFDQAYKLARQKVINGEDISKDDFLHNNFSRVVVDSFRKKCVTGLDVINYPQHYDMYKQFTEPIREAMSKGTYLVDEKQAVIPEIVVINGAGKELSEEFGRRLLLRVCVTGPMELYLREVGSVFYEDVLSMFAETVKRFAENSILNSKYVKTEVVSIDEPSFGFQDISADRDEILQVLEKTFGFDGVTKQIHLHSSARISDVLQVAKVDVLMFEYAGSPNNIEGVSREMLEKADKHVRVGVARTDVDAISAELTEKGGNIRDSTQLVETEETIRRRFAFSKEKYGERMIFTGPDCGLGGWPTQEVAQLLLQRTVNAVKTLEKA